MIGLPSLDLPETFVIDGANPYGMVRLSLTDQLLLFWHCQADDFSSSEFGGDSYSFVTIDETDRLALELCGIADRSETFEGPEDDRYFDGETVIIYLSDRGWPTISDQSWPTDSEELAKLRAEIDEQCYGPEEEEETETEEDSEHVRTFADDLRECEDFYSDSELFGNDGTCEPKEGN